MSERKGPAPKAAPPTGGGPRGPRAMGPRQPIHRESVARLLKYVAPFWPRLILVLCCIIVNAVATASAATFLGRVIDDYITPLLAQAAGGLDYMVEVAARFLRRHPNHITFYAPLTTWLFCILAGTAHTCYALLPIISEILN